MSDSIIKLHDPHEQLRIHGPTEEERRIEAETGKKCTTRLEQKLENLIRSLRKDATEACQMLAHCDFTGGRGLRIHASALRLAANDLEEVLQEATRRDRCPPGSLVDPLSEEECGSVGNVAARLHNSIPY